MLDIAVDNARIVMENIKRFMASPLGIFVQTVLSGMVGVVILLAFFSMVLSGSALTMVLPLIIAFNAATSGYGLIDKEGRDFPRLKTSLVAVSILLAVTGYVALSVMVVWESMPTGLYSLVLGLSALIFSFFGSRIALKSKNTDQSPQA